jgi:hypothetical protein
MNQGALAIVVDGVAEASLSGEAAKLRVDDLRRQKFVAPLTG